MLLHSVDEQCARLADLHDLSQLGGNSNPVSGSYVTTSKTILACITTCKYDNGYDWACDDSTKKMNTTNSPSGKQYSKVENTTCTPYRRFLSSSGVCVGEDTSYTPGSCSSSYDNYTDP